MSVKNVILKIFFFCLFSASVTAFSQQKMDEVSASGLLYEASRNLSAGNYAAAIPYLQEYLTRMESINDDRVAALKQSVRLKLAKIYAHMEDPITASDYLQQYTRTLPRYQPREAWKLLALTLYESGQFEPCVVAVEMALTNPLRQELSNTEQKANVDEMTKEQMAGFSARQLRRIEEAAAEAEDSISASISDEVPDAEPEYTTAERVSLYMTLAEAQSELENWEASIAPYEYVIDNAEEGDRKGYAIMKLVKALIALERFDDAKDFIVTLYNTEARYDIRVNMALMNAAAKLFEVEKYDSALMLYRMILPRHEMVTYQVAKMNTIRRDAGLPRVEIQTTTNAMGRVLTIFGNQSEGQVMVENTIVSGLPPKPEELVKLEEATQVLLGLPPYEDDVLYRTGLLFARAGRPWEAVSALDYIAGLEPDSEKGQDAFVQALMVLADPLKKYDLVEERGMLFLNTYTKGRGPRQVAHALTGAYQKQERWADIKELLPVIELFETSEDPAILQYDCELHYMQAIADIVLLKYDAALTGFERVLKDYPESHQEENSRYWHAMAQLFLKNYEDAVNEYDYYIDSWTNGVWLPSSTFHSGVALFGMEKYDEAQERFTQVINSFKESDVYSDACAMRADLQASKGELEAAQTDYEEAIAKAQLPRQATYAVFQLSAMFELEERYEEILNVVNAYLDRYGEEADVAKAAYWIGKTKQAQGLTGEAVEAYRETIIKYGAEVLQDGVDLIIGELLSIYQRQLDVAEQEALKESLRAAWEETDNVTLQLRIRVLLAWMEQNQLELGEQLIQELDQLEQAPPPVLGVICDASFELKDYTRAAEILDLFQIRYEESDFMRSALKLRAYELFDLEQYDAVRAIIAEAQARYGTALSAAWAQIMKGRVELREGHYDEARKTFEAVLSVRDWRGEPYAEATFYLGRVEEEAGDPRRAFGWYQRVYVLYKGYSGGYWAAEGYLASARCLEKMGRENDVRNTYRALLFDKYVNTLPQADVAINVLGPDEVNEIKTLIEQGMQTNLTVTVESKEPVKAETMDEV
ncbi:tetratricopeptide repeat protein [Pontiella sp.]|uniref:tetratricopeptide repeat protein n=1 Tax=Pontiella sp. TaxID=2837462 RepID=UPI00356683FF